ncbi:riboflavin synthase, partial [Paracoccus sp. PXZ]
MFTGIITDIGEVSRVEMRGDMRARISCHYEMAGVDLGASIACDGICLTVVERGSDWFDVDISAETISKTNIGANGWAPGKRLNLERALRVG